MNTEPDEQADRLLRLLQQTASRNESAFEQLYQAYAPKLLGVLIRILKKRPIAEEALQEVFVRIWNKAGNYDASKGSAAVWMTSIARYYALDMLRRQKLREDHESTLTSIDLDVVGDSRFQPFDIKLADNEILNHCLDQLGEKQRHCIVRSYCEGASHDELSDELSTPLGTVKSWIRRGLKALRECVGELH